MTILMEKKRKSYRYSPYAAIVLVFALLWLVMLVCAGLYDLDISLAVADPLSPFGRFLEIAGEPPAILFTSFNFSLIAVCLLRRENRRGRDTLLAALCVVGTVGTAYYTTNATFNYLRDWRADLGLSFISGGVKMSFALIISALLSVLFLFIAFRSDRKRLENFLPAAAHCVLAAVLTLVVIWCFKLVWGRVRFRQLGDVSDFTPFWHPNGFTGFFSFPSGHTANATVILTVTYYFRFLGSKTKAALRPALFVWIVIVALSRVLVGAHYLSDVLCGFAITAVIVFLCRPKKKAEEKNVYR